MSWLSLIGLSLDGVGAALIAWPLLAPADASREEATPRWGGNPWVVILRRRERALVAWGAAFLSVGFLLQAIAQIARWGSHREQLAALVLVIIVLFLGVLIGRRLAERGLPRYVTAAGRADRLDDQRDTYLVQTVGDWRQLLEAFVFEQTGRPIEAVPSRAPARVNHGRWVASCPDCRNDTMAWPENPHAICTACRICFPVDFPPASEQAVITRLLLDRPMENRNWTAPETVDDLRAENRDHGLLDE